MAWLEVRNQQYHIGVRIGDRKLKRSLKTDDQREAQLALDRIERRLKLVEQGEVSIPPDADVLTFLLTDGKMSKPVVIETGLTLKAACDQWEASIPEGNLEKNTLYTARIHLNHLRRVLSEQLRFDRLKFADLQRYVDQRAKAKGRHGRPLSPTTIRKELVTLSGVWTWCQKMGLVQGVFPNRGLRYPKSLEKPQFQTWTEIERQISLGQAVLGNCGSFVAFRVGAEDAELLAPAFSKYPDQVTPAALMGLPNYTGYVRLLLDGGVPSAPFSLETLPPPEISRDRSDIVRRASRRRFGDSSRQESLSLL